MMNDSLPTNDGGNGGKKWDDAVRWTKNFRKNFASEPGMIRGYSITADEINRLLKQGGHSLHGLKMYFGYDEQQQFRLIIVATDDKGNDHNVPHGHQQTAALATEAASASETPSATEELPELGDTRPCPIYCGTSNDLNGGA